MWWSEWSWWGWVMMSVTMAAFWGVIGYVVYLVVRSDDDRSRAPEDLLADRFALGEIDEDEYRRRLAALRGASGRHEGVSR